MDDKQLKLIYEYMKPMGWNYAYRLGASFDSNRAYECMLEMERKGDWNNNMTSFLSYVFDDAYPPNDFKDVMMSREGFIVMFDKIMNPDNFFNCMAKWLEVRYDRQST